MEFKHRKKWVDKNGAKCNMVFGRTTKNTPTDASSTLHGGGLGRREDGHTGRYETKEEEEDEDDGREERERAPNRTAGEWKWGKR